MSSSLERGAGTGQQMVKVTANLEYFKGSCGQLQEMIFISVE
jgi:hypothetical protein